MKNFIDQLVPVAWYDPDDFTRVVSRPNTKESKALYDESAIKTAYKAGEMSNINYDKLFFAALFLNRYEPMQPHHVSALRERLGYLTDEELLKFVRTGIWPNG
jgi:hypothetical protein